MAQMGRRPDALKHRFERILDEANAYERMKQLLMKTNKDETFVKAFEVCHERAFGKPTQVNENYNYDDPDKPTTESLVETIRVLREELGSLREGIKLETKE